MMKEHRIDISYLFPIGDQIPTSVPVYATNGNLLTNAIIGQVDGKVIASITLEDTIDAPAFSFRGRGDVVDDKVSKYQLTHINLFIPASR